MNQGLSSFPEQMLGKEKLQNLISSSSKILPDTICQINVLYILRNLKILKHEWYFLLSCDWHSLPVIDM